MRQVNVYYLLRKPGKYFGSYEHIAALVALAQKDCTNIVYTSDVSKEEFAVMLNTAQKTVLTSLDLFDFKDRVKAQHTRIKDFTPATEIQDNLFMGKELEELVEDSKKLLIVLPYTGWSVENFLDTLDRMPAIETLDVDEISIITSVQLSSNLSKDVFLKKCKPVCERIGRLRKAIGYRNFKVPNFIMDKKNVLAKDCSGLDTNYVSMDAVQMMTLIRGSARRGVKYEKLCRAIFFDDILRKESLIRTEPIGGTVHAQVNIPNFTDRDLKILEGQKDTK